MNGFARERTLFILAICACGLVFTYLYGHTSTKSMPTTIDPLLWGMNVRDVVEFAALAFSAVAVVRAAWLVWARRDDLRGMRLVIMAVIGVFYFTHSLAAPVLGAKLLLMLTLFSAVGFLAVVRERRGE